MYNKCYGGGPAELVFILQTGLHGDLAAAALVLLLSSLHRDQVSSAMSAAKVPRECFGRIGASISSYRMLWSSSMGALTLWYCSL